MHVPKPAIGSAFMFALYFYALFSSGINASLSVLFESCNEAYSCYGPAPGEPLLPLCSRFTTGNRREPAVLLQIPEGSFLLDLWFIRSSRPSSLKPFQILFSVLVKLFSIHRVLYPVLPVAFCCGFPLYIPFYTGIHHIPGTCKQLSPARILFWSFSFHMAGKKRFPIAAGITVC